MKGCTLCSRLTAYRASIEPKKAFGSYRYHNAPVEPFGDPKAWLLVVGMAPGAHGANRTSRPFTGDGAGEIFYPAIYNAGLANQPYSGEYDENFRLNGVLVTNVVRCVPPGNKPTPEEFRTCRPYLQETLKMPSVTDILCIGRDAWEHVHRGLEIPATPFEHGLNVIIGRKLKEGELRPDHCIQSKNIHLQSMREWKLWAIYHTSRYNQNTGRISQKDVEDILRRIKQGM